MEEEEEEERKELTLYQNVIDIVTPPFGSDSI